MKDFELLECLVDNVRDIVENGYTRVTWSSHLVSLFDCCGADFNAPPSHIVTKFPQYLQYVREVLNKQESPAWAPSLSAELAGRDVPRGDLEWALHQVAVREVPDGGCREQTYLERIATLKYEDICDGEKWMRVRGALTRLHKATQEGWNDAFLVTLLFDVRDAVRACFPMEMGLVNTSLVLGEDDE